jgi:hypothetical protein
MVTSDMQHPSNLRHTFALEERSYFQKLLGSRSIELFSTKRLRLGFGTRDESIFTWSEIDNGEGLDNLMQMSGLNDVRPV